MADQLVDATVRASQSFEVDVVVIEPRELAHDIVNSNNGRFKSFFDILKPDLLAGRPVLIAATGGTARHSLALEHAIRPLFSYLHAIALPTAVFAATDDFGGSEVRALTQRIARAGVELADAIEKGQPVANPDPYASA